MPGVRKMKFRNAVVSGYDKAEVDAFVARVLRALEEPNTDSAVSEAEITQTEFGQAWLGAGYRNDDVDQWLDNAEFELHIKRRG